MKMKSLFLSALLAPALLTIVPARGAEPSALPEFVAADLSASPVASADLAFSRNWMLVVLDAGLPSARRFLDALGSKQDRFGDNVVILALGDAVQLEQLRAAYAQLGDVRWLRSQDAGLLTALGLTGVPARIAMRADGRVAHRRAGLGRGPEDVAQQVRAWAGVLPGQAEDARP